MFHECLPNVIGRPESAHQRERSHGISVLTHWHMFAFASVQHGGLPFCFRRLQSSRWSLQTNADDNEAAFLFVLDSAAIRGRNHFANWPSANSLGGLNRNHDALADTPATDAFAACIAAHSGSDSFG